MKFWPGRTQDEANPTFRPTNAAPCWVLDRALQPLTRLCPWAKRACALISLISFDLLATCHSRHQQSLSGALWHDASFSGLRANHLEAIGLDPCGPPRFLSSDSLATASSPAARLCTLRVLPPGVLSPSDWEGSDRSLGVRC